MRFQAVTQIVLVGISLVIIFTVVRPMFADIRADQDEIERYQEAIATVDLFNTRLAELRTRANSLSVVNRRALDTYLPTTIDLLSVSRDIREIAAQNSVVVQSVGPDESSTETEAERAAADQSVGLDASDGGVPVPLTLARQAAVDLERERFALVARGTYDQLVGMLTDFERNVYPIRLITFELMVDSESDTYTANILLETYALPAE